MERGVTYFDRVDRSLNHRIVRTALAKEGAGIGLWKREQSERGWVSGGMAAEGNHSNGVQQRPHRPKCDQVRKSEKHITMCVTPCPVTPTLTPLALVAGGGGLAVSGAWKATLAAVLCPA